MIGLHRFTVFLCGATWILLIAGASVTSTGSGLAVPDWPLSFGQFFPPMVGGVFYEHGHRLIAALVGFLTLILAIWTWLSKPPKVVRILATIALGTVLLQGLLGGLTVLYLLPAPISIIHACLAQTFFCLVASLALATSRSWQNPPRLVTSWDRSAWIKTLSLATTATLYIQLILGAALRHGALGIVPHILGAVAALSCAYGTLALATQNQDPTLFSRPCVLMVGLTCLQIILGIPAFFMRGQGAWIPTAHVACGALLLATSWVISLRCFKHLATAEKLPLPWIPKKYVYSAN